MYILPACITFIHKTDSSNITNSFFCVQVAFTKSAHIEKIAQSSDIIVQIYYSNSRTRVPKKKLHY